MEYDDHCVGKWSDDRDEGNQMDDSGLWKSSYIKDGHFDLPSEQSKRHRNKSKKLNI